MIEPEIAFADLNDDADLAEDFLKYLFRAVLDERMDDMTFIAERVQKDAVTRLEKFINAPFERIDYSDAIKLLQASGKTVSYTHLDVYKRQCLTKSMRVPSTSGRLSAST